MKEIMKLALKNGYNTEVQIVPKNYDYLELCLIQKWLREEKKIQIDIIAFNTPLLSGYYSFIHKYDETEVVPTYETALFEGIKKALEMI